jgi:hypothetical protein
MLTRRILMSATVVVCALVSSVSLQASDGDIGSFQLGQVPSKTVWHGTPYSFLVQWEGHPAIRVGGNVPTLPTLPTSFRLRSR